MPLTNKYSKTSASNLTLGQKGSAYLDTAGTTFTPTDHETGRAVIAITALTDVKFSTLTAESANTFVNTAGAGAGGGGDTFSSSDVIPKGTTIYGRWTSVSVSADGEKCICYIG